MAELLRQVSAPRRISVLLALTSQCGGYNMLNEQVLPLHDITDRGGHYD